MIILFEENELNFTSLGLGVLKDAKSCDVNETLNDLFELEMEYPYNGVLYDQLKIDRIIFAPPNPYDESQPFRIYSISKPIKGYVTIKAQHLSYDLNGIPCKPINAGSLRDACDKIQNGSLIEHNFKFYTDKSESKTFKTTGYYNMRALLMGDENSLLGKFDLEAKFDKYNIYLLSRRGADKGATISYAKNLKDITHDINYEKLYNGVYPFYHQESQQTTTNTTMDGFKQCYIVGNKPYQDGWLSYTPDGEPYHPVDESPIQVATEGNYYKKVYCWNTTSQRYVEKVYDQMITLMDSVGSLLGQQQETPQWVVIDWSQITSLKLVIKAGESGYFKLSTESEYTYHPKGDIVFQGSIQQSTDALMLYYSEVLPPTSSSETEETTVSTHVELSDKIIWIDTELAKSMKVNRVLTLDLTSEFDEAPDEDALRTKANEYIEKNKIGQYKFDTSVSFIDLSSTTEGKQYKNIDTVELGDTVKVIYNDIGIDVELRVVETNYDVILGRYSNITLGEKPDKLSSSSVQQGDGVSSLTNDVGYADATTVNKLIAKIVTADYIKAKNAEMSKAMIEQLETARIRCTGIIEASQFELDTLVAKMLTADNAVIKQTLEAGTVKVNGDITIASGSIKIENKEIGTSFVVDRDGNVTANSLMITGGSIRIQDTFEVTNDGELTAINARIEGHIIAKTGEIAGFEIKDNYLQYKEEFGSDYVYVGTDAIKLGEAFTEVIEGTYVERYPFYVTNKGYLYASDAEIVKGSIAGFKINQHYNTSSQIYDKGWIAYNKESLTDNKFGVYIGTDGISLGANSVFKIDQYGNVTANALTATNANISGYINASSGKIGNFNISNGSIVYTSGSGSNQKRIYIGTDKIELGPTNAIGFMADVDGNVSIKKNFKISPGGFLAFQEKYLPTRVVFKPHYYFTYTQAKYYEPGETRPFIDGTYVYTPNSSDYIITYDDQTNILTVSCNYAFEYGDDPAGSYTKFVMYAYVNINTGNVTYKGEMRYTMSVPEVYANVTSPSDSNYIKMVEYIGLEVELNPWLGFKLYENEISAVRAIYAPYQQSIEAETRKYISIRNEKEASYIKVCNGDTETTLASHSVTINSNCIVIKNDQNIVTINASSIKSSPIMSSNFSIGSAYQTKVRVIRTTINQDSWYDINASSIGFTNIINVVAYYVFSSKPTLDNFNTYYDRLPVVVRISNTQWHVGNDRESGTFSILVFGY